jgi:hypothetical protein
MMLHDTKSIQDLIFSVKDPLNISGRSIFLKNFLGQKFLGSMHIG